MRRSVQAGPETWPLIAPFRISRGVRTAAELVTVALGEGDVIGLGEAMPSVRYGETQESVLEQIASVAGALAGGATREALRSLLPAGAARNAVDCAIWDLEARLGRQPAATLAAGAWPPIRSAITIGLDSPERMAAAARRAAGARLLKLKLDAVDPEARLAAVRAAAPGARLLVDANEAWSVELLERLQPALVAAGVELVEQPLPAATDADLAGFASSVPLCADESCHTRADLGRLKGRYRFVNIKLDKTGGLTEALDLLDAARRAGFGIMVGCMMCTSLGVRAALPLAVRADVVDLDGPLWLERDRSTDLRIDPDGVIVTR